MVSFTDGTALPWGGLLALFWSALVGCICVKYAGCTETLTTWRRDNRQSPARQCGDLTAIAQRNAAVYSRISPTNRNQRDASSLLLTCSHVHLSRAQPARGPNCYRAANPRRLLFVSLRDHRTESKCNGDVSLREGCQVPGGLRPRE